MTDKNMPVISGETQAILSMIEQIALNPQADVEKMRAAMDMKMAIFNRGAEVEYNAAMARAQAEIEPVARKAQNKQTNSSYAKLEHIIQQCAPVWTRHGFALSFGSDECPKPNHYRVTCVCSHSAGHSVKYQADLPEDVSGIAGARNKTGIHGFGSTMSYGRRYLTCMIFNVALANEDNDGNRPKAPVSGLNEAQKKSLLAAMKGIGMTAEQFCAHPKIAVASLDEFPPQRLKGALAWIEQQRTAK